ncbi:MAG: M1 family metallopeptidase [Phycisphaerae bacterium]
MKRFSATNRVATVLPVLGTALLGGGGCATFPGFSPPTISVQAHLYRIDVDLDPARHRLTGRSVMDVERTDDRALPPDRPVAVELLLHPDLKITRVHGGGVRVLRRTIKRDKSAPDAATAPRTHVIVLDRPADAFALFVDYDGTLYQDKSAGERPGEIHNFTMNAHVGEDGVYLGGGYWYPEPVADEHVQPRLATYTLVATPVDGIELVASGEPDAAMRKQTGRLAWRSPYPLDGMVLVGGAHEVHETTHNATAIAVHVKPGQRAQVQGLTDAVRGYLDRYEPLIGPYPAANFAVVDNFFSSGFAFPTFTLLSSAVIDMGRRSQTSHGYIDHEVLHCWWGNGIFVDPRDGNWCESLASYGANYFGHVLDGNMDEARRARRNYAHFLSRMKPARDRPLATFGREDGCSRGIAYSKGAAVLHMLARKIGQDNFWAAMRRFTNEYVGRYASWDDIRRLCEDTSGVSLETFFRQWVRSSGAPTLGIDYARYEPSGQTLTVRVTQGEPAFDLDVPLRIHHAAGVVDLTVPLATPAREVPIPVDVMPQSVEIDPDYHIFRRVPLTDIFPTTAATRYGSAFAVVLPTGDVPEAYRTIRSMIEPSFEDDERVAYTAGDIEEGALAERCVLILGDAVRDAYTAAFLSAIEFPVHWTDNGFEFDGVTYTADDDAVLCTIAHPGVPGGGVTVVYANSEPAIPGAVTFYDRSLVIFKDRKPVLRRDFERRRIVPVEVMQP